MRKKNYKGRCQKRTLNKCTGVFHSYSDIQYVYAEILEKDNSIKAFSSNVLLEGISEGEYTSDFICTKANGEIFVRECVLRNHLTKPMTIKLLDLSREYWLKKGVTDWGLVIDEE